ncbi:hypothetical protein SB860_39340, partial [Burkholderia sp. SIMBA_019]
VVLTLIVAAPAATQLTAPADETVAIDVSPLDHAIVLLAGSTVACAAADLPTTSASVVGVTLRLVVTAVLAVALVVAVSQSGE